MSACGLAIDRGYLRAATSLRSTLSPPQPSHSAVTDKTPIPMHAAANIRSPGTHRPAKQKDTAERSLQPSPLAEGGQQDVHSHTSPAYPHQAIRPRHDRYGFGHHRISHSASVAPPRSQKQHGRGSRSRTECQLSRSAQAIESRRCRCQSTSELLLVLQDERCFVGLGTPGNDAGMCSRLQSSISRTKTCNERALDCCASLSRAARSGSLQLAAPTIN